PQGPVPRMPGPPLTPRGAALKGEARKQKGGITMAERLTWRVIEDNSGGLHLAVFEDGRCIYYRYGYEQDDGEGMRSDLGVLRRGIDPRSGGWDLQDDVDDPQAWYESLRVGEVNGGVVVADQDGIYPDRMGTAARLALTPDINIDDYITTYSDGRGQEHEAIQLPWHVVEDILSHEHTGAAEEDRRLIQALQSAGAPDWVTPDVEGWVDEHGWGIYAPTPPTETTER